MFRAGMTFRIKNRAREMAAQGVDIDTMSDMLRVRPEQLQAFFKTETKAKNPERVNAEEPAPDAPVEEQQEQQEQPRRGRRRKAASGEADEGAPPDE